MLYYPLAGLIFSYKYKLTNVPTGKESDNLAFVLQIPPEEKSITELKISTFEVYKNDELLWEQKNFDSKIDYNAWINDKGQSESNYQVLFHCMPQNYNGSFSVGDEIIDIPPCEYPTEEIPDEKISYNNISYKLVFYDDFNTDYSDSNPLKNGMYKQALDEIDFFEYSPSLNMIRTGSRSCNSIIIDLQLDMEEFICLLILAVSGMCSVVSGMKMALLLIWIISGLVLFQHII